MHAGLILEKVKKACSSWLSRFERVNRSGPRRESDHRMKREEAFNQAYTPYRIVADYVFDWEYWIEPHERFIYVSPSCSRITGYSAEEFLTHPGLFMEIIHPEDRGLVRHHLDEINEERGIEQLEFRILCRDGSTRWIGHVCQPVFDESGKFLGRRCSNRSIDKRKITEAALAASEEKYRELVESANSIVLSWRPDGEITFINKFAQTFFGYSSEEILGKNVMTLVPDRDSLGADLSGLAADIVEHPERYVGNVNENVRINGERVWVNWTNRAIVDETGKIREILTIGNDITALKRLEGELGMSEERYRNIVEHSPEGIAVHCEGRFVYINPAGASLLGAAAPEAVIGKPIADIIHPESLDSVRERIRDTERGRPTPPKEQKLVRLDGATFDAEVIGIPFRFGGLAATQIIMRDITGRKETEAVLARLASFPNFNPSPIIETDLDGNVHYCNLSARALFPDLVHRGPGHPFLTDWGGFTSAFRDGTLKTFEREAIVDGRYYHQTILFVESGRHLRIYGLDITALKNAENELRRSNRQLEILAETASRLLISSQPQRIINELCRKIMTHLDCQVFFNYLVDENRDCLHLNACDGIPEETARDIEWLGFGVAVCGCVAREGRRIVAEHILDTQDPRTDLVRSFGIQAYACHPLISEGRVIGTLSFGTRTRHSFTADEIAMMRAVADQVSIAMERMRYIEDLKTTRRDLQISHDALESRVREKTEELWQSVARLETEVAERKRAEENLRESQRKLYDTLESITDGFFTLDRNWRFTYMNTGAEKIWKMKKETLIGRNLWEVSPVATGTVFEEKYRKAMIDRVPVFFEALSPLVRTWVEIRAYPTAEGIAVHARDISERKKAEEALRLATVYNRNLIEASPDPLVTIDPDGRISDVNTATEHATGYLREELIGTDFSDYFTDPEMARTGYRLVFQQGSVRDYALEIKHRDGPLTPVLYNATVYRDEAGRVVGVFAAARDISERKKAEEALRLATAYNRSLIEASPDPLVTIDPDGRISDVNTATEHATGYLREELIGTDFSDYFTDPEMARKGYRLVFQEGSVRDYALEIRHRNSRVTPVLYNATVYRDGAGKVVGVFAAARDITGRLEMEKKLRESNEQLRALTSELVMAEEKARRRIAVDLHDHVSQSLAVAKLRLETLQESASESGLLEPVREVRDLINESIQQTRSLMTELSPSVLYELGFTAAVEWLLEQLKAKHGVTVRLESDLKMRRLDQDLQVLLFQTVRELFFNIVKHAKASHASVTIREIGDHIRVRVKDDGVGFDKSRLGNGMDREGGFGLFSIRERLEHFGGRLDIHTRPGKGTSVTIEAPRRKSRISPRRMGHVH